MIAFPVATPVTSPVELTVAIAILLELQVTFLFVAFAGAMVAVNCEVPPTLTEAVIGVTDTPVTVTLFVPTVTTEVAVFKPSAVVAVMVAFPADTPVTKPVEVTVAIAGPLVLHN